MMKVVGNPENAVAVSGRIVMRVGSFAAGVPETAPLPHEVRMARQARENAKARRRSAVAAADRITGLPWNVGAADRGLATCCPRFYA
jgi:hypothetical protein